MRAAAAAVGGTPGGCRGARRGWQLRVRSLAAQDKRIRVEQSPRRRRWTLVARRRPQARRGEPRTILERAGRAASGAAPESDPTRAGACALSARPAPAPAAHARRPLTTRAVLCAKRPLAETLTSVVVGHFSRLAYVWRRRDEARLLQKIERLHVLLPGCDPGKICSRAPKLLEWDMNPGTPDHAALCAISIRVHVLLRTSPRPPAGFVPGPYLLLGTRVVEHAASLWRGASHDHGRCVLLVAAAAMGGGRRLGGDQDQGL